MYGYKRQFRKPELIEGELLLQPGLKALEEGMVAGT